MIRVLIADDEPRLRQVLATELSGEGISVSEADSGEKALDLLDAEDIDVLLLDINMPGMSGIEVLKKIKSLDMFTEVIVLTADSTASTAVGAMKLGAYDYLTKPFRLEDLHPLIEKAYEKKRLQRENLLLKTGIKRESENMRIIAGSPIMRDLLEMVDKVAPTDLTLLITGESGVGKELIARRLHLMSGRSEGPFIAINCGAIPENMMESELFGYERSAFTGAQSRKLGLIEIAHGGTLFLDEIGEMPLQLQTKLLRAIENGRFFRLGGTKETAVDIRVISATNKDLKDLIERGLFRQDLYYRITQLIIPVPPLRQRKEDIDLLIEHIIKANPAFRRKRFGDDAMKVLKAYPWPGNVRELHNIVQRTLLLSTGDLIQPGDLPQDLLPAAAAVGERLDEVEKNHIMRVLGRTGGHRARAAEMLGIDPKTLYRKLREYGIKP